VVPKVGDIAPLGAVEISRGGEEERGSKGTAVRKSKVRTFV
jgi:hypothetical protein